MGHRHCHPHQNSGRRVTSVGSPWGVHRDNRAASPQPACFPTPSTALGLGAGSDPCKVLPTCLKLHLCCSPHSISAYTAMTAAIATHPLALGTPEPPPAPRIWWLSTGRGLLPDFCPIPTLPPRPPPPSPINGITQLSEQKWGAGETQGWEQPEARGCTPQLPYKHQHTVTVAPTPRLLLSLLSIDPGESLFALDLLHSCNLGSRFRTLLRSASIWVGSPRGHPAVSPHR